MATSERKAHGRYSAGGVTVGQRRLVLVVLVILCIPFLEGCKSSIDDKAVAADLAELQKWISSHESYTAKKGSMGIFDAPEGYSRVLWGIDALKNGIATNRPSDTRELLRAGQPALRTTSTGELVQYTLDYLTPECFEADLRSRLQKRGAPQKTVDRGIALLRECPDWWPQWVEAVVLREPGFNLTKQMMREMLGEPTRTQATATYDAWWYSLGKDKRGFFVFNRPAGRDGQVCYFVMDE
jgi:hypothetical protein